MEMERILSMGSRLQKLLIEAKAEAERMVSEAQKEADEMIDTAKTESNRRRMRAQRGTGLEEMLAEEEKKAVKEAAKVAKDYKKQVEELRKVPAEKMESAVELVLKEVLPE